MAATTSPHCFWSRSPREPRSSGTNSSLTSAFLGVSTLFFWKWVLSLLSSRSRAASALLLGHPTQVMRDGEVDERELRHLHLSMEELRSELRAQHGTDDLGQVSAAFLGTNGKPSFVVRRQQ